MCVYMFFLIFTITGEGNLYSCGWNKEGQLGQEEEESVLIPRIISNLPKLVKVACGWSHSLAIDGTLCHT